MNADALHPRHLKAYLEMTPKAISRRISKAIRRIRLLLGKELRGRGRENLIPRAWTHTEVE